MRTIEIKKTSITALETDAIVNAANEGLLPGGGVCGAIFQAAGYGKLQKACLQIGHCPTGSAVITPGFDLSARYVIHAVGPRWTDGKHREPELLYGAYRKALELAVRNGCRSIGFPLISSGIYGYPVQGAWQEAFRACGDFLDRHPKRDLRIVFAALSDEIIEIGRKVLLNSDASRYKIAEKSDWKTLDMPWKHTVLIYQCPFTPEQMAALRCGHIPQEMEDKWFWYMEGDRLFAHRSWTGYCIFRVDFDPDDSHVVTMNRDPEQYQSTDLAQAVEMMDRLLHRWSGKPLPEEETDDNGAGC